MQDSRTPATTTLPRIAVALALALGVISGCGTVVVHKEGTGGAGGNGGLVGATTAATSVTTKSASVTTIASSSTGTIADLCDAYCAATGDCYPDCQTKCQ